MENLNYEQLFDGYCPESKLEGKRVQMRLNKNDFYESEATGLQIVFSYPRAQATVLNFRGKGDFRHTVSYADENVNGESLSLQHSDKFPYCSKDIFEDGREFSKYIKKHVKIMLKVPSDRLVDEYIQKFKDNERANLSDIAIQTLIDAFPTNVHQKEILLKVVAINSLYSTSIYDTISIAKHIQKLNIDEKLSKGDPQLVHEIAVGHGIKSSKRSTQLNFYSFATKYCSWHNQTDYSIYDSFIERILIGYKKNDAFSSFNQLNLKDYKEFKKVIEEFKKYYSLSQSKAN